MKSALSLALVVCVIVASSLPVDAQEQTETPGSLAQTVTLDATQLTAPNAQSRFADARLVTRTSDGHVKEVMGQTTAHILPPDLLRTAAFREASRLADTLALAPRRQQSRQRSWAGSHPVLLGALVGAGIGVGWAAINCDLAHKNTDFPCKSVFAVVGAEFGGAVGFIVSIGR